MNHHPTIQPEPLTAELLRRCAALGAAPFLLAPDGALVRPGAPATPPPGGAAALERLADAARALRDGRPADAAGCGAVLRSGADVLAALPPADLPPDRLAAALELWRGDLAAVQSDRLTLDGFSRELMTAYEQMSLLFRFSRLLNCSDDPRDVVRMVAHQILGLLPFTWVVIAFADDTRVLPDLRGSTTLCGDVACGFDALQREVENAIAACRHDAWTTVLELGQHPLADLTGSQALAEPVTHDGVPIGMILVGGKSGPDADAHSAELQFIDATAEFIGVFHENAARFHEQRVMFLGTLRAVTAAIDAKDRYTRGHSERVAYMGRALAEAASLDPEQVEQIYIAGLVHDVGKIGVPERVLCKPGRLTDEEFAFIREHPTTGYNILKDIPPLTPMLPGVLHHHERWDGRGYPAGLAGEDIPLYGRILAVADTFDAMSSNRSYRPALPRERVLEEIERCAGTQFDPDLAPLFIRLDFSGFDRLLAEHQALHSTAA